MTGPGGRVLTSGTRTSAEPARRLDQLYGEYIHACQIPFWEVGKKIKEFKLEHNLKSYMRFFDQEIFLGVKNGRAWSTAWSPEFVIVFIVVLFFGGRYSCQVSVAWPRQITPLLLWTLSSCKSFPLFQEICIEGNYNTRAKTIVKDNLHDTAGMGRGRAQANIKNKGARVLARGLQCRFILIFNRVV